MKNICKFRLASVETLAVLLLFLIIGVAPTIAQAELKLTKASFSVGSIHFETAGNKERNGFNPGIFLEWEDTGKVFFSKPLTVGLFRNSRNYEANTGNYSLSFSNELWDLQLAPKLSIGLDKGVAIYLPSIRSGEAGKKYPVNLKPFIRAKAEYHLTKTSGITLGYVPGVEPLPALLTLQFFKTF